MEASSSSRPRVAAVADAAAYFLVAAGIYITFGFLGTVIVFFLLLLLPPYRPMHWLTGLNVER